MTVTVVLFSLCFLLFFSHTCIIINTMEIFIGKKVRFPTVIQF